MLIYLISHKTTANFLINYDIYWLYNFQSATKPWQRSIIVLALGKIGVKEAIQVLEGVIDGTVEKSTKVRVAAILGLSRSYLPTELKHEVSIHFNINLNKINYYLLM